MDEYLNQRSFMDESEAILNSAQPFSPCNDTNDSQTTDDNQNWVLLGLRAFKSPNNTQQVFNILSKSPEDEQLETADFDSEMRAHLPYSYARNVCKNNSRIEDNGQKEVEEWLKSMPREPDDRSKGFKKGDADKWFKHVHGADHVHALGRVLKKSDMVQRPNKNAYANTAQALQPDQEILDSLPTEEFFTGIRNSHNMGE